MKQRFGIPETEVGKWMLENMTRLDLSCVDVANKLHITRQVVAYHVNGHHKPNYPFIMAYCHIFGDIDDPEEIWKLTIEEG